MVALGQAGHALADGVMIPAPSWPRITGGGCGMVPLRTDRSEWQTPVATILILTCTGAGLTDLEAVDDLEGVVTGVAHERSAHGCLLGFGE